MFLSRLLNQGNAPLLEQTVRFTAARHRLLTENIANLSTPGYRQKDLSVQKFQAALRQKIEDRATAPPGEARFDDMELETQEPARNILFHDRNNRSAEQLMSDLAKNAMMHNLAVELLRKQYQAVEAALKERVV
jgi:flagellar basal-body rod protein FlgB